MNKDWKLHNSIIIAITLGMIFVIYWGTYYHASKEFESTIANINRDLSNYTFLIEQATQKTLNNIDQILLFVKDKHENSNENIDLASYIKKFYILDNVLNQIGIIDRSGKYIFSSLPDHKIFDLSDRDHFTVHIPADTKNVFISKPLIGRATGKPSIQLSRRLNNPDGSFAGVVVTSINPYFLSDIYNDINLGKDGLIAIVGTDGIVRARQKMNEFTFGQDLNKSKFMAYSKTMNTYNYEATSRIDYISRFYCFRKIPNYPLLVLIGISKVEALRDYYAQKNIYYIFSSGISFLLLAFCLLILTILHNKRTLLLNLELSKNQANKANKSKTDFLAKVTHELRTPLSAIKGMNDFLLQTNLNKEQHECANTIKDSSTHLITIVNDLLDLSKIEAGQIVLEYIDFNLYTLVESTIRIMRPLAREKNIAFSFDWLGDKEVVVKSDPARVRQILFNLLYNAIKFTSKGEVRIVSKIEKNEYLGNYSISICVNDTGIGIPNEAFEKIFIPFSQGHDSTSREYGGTGLGLAICEQLAKLMGGAISVSSIYGVGSKFCLSIDADAGSKDHDQTKDSQTEPKQLKICPLDILVVDDNNINLKVAQKLFSLLDQNPILVNSGKDALEMLKSTTFDVAFFDVEMPGLNGFELTKIIRDGKTTPDSRHIHVIAMTAYSFDSIKEKCIESGMDDFITKPIDINELHDKLSHISKRLWYKQHDTECRSQQASIGNADNLLAICAVLNIDYALSRLGNDHELYNEICFEFYNKYNGNATRTFFIENRSNTENVRLFIHTLKGVSRTIGAERVGAIVEQIELMALNNNLEKIDTFLPQLIYELEEVHKVLNEFIKV